MFPIDTGLLATIMAPVILVSFLILVKIRQEKANRRLQKASNPQTANRESGSPTEEAQTIQRNPEKTKQNKCQHYLGYLHNSARAHPLFKINSDSSSFPEECYGCPKLLECFYSRTTIQRIYGNEDDKT
jgi:hypothetical protein